MRTFLVIALLVAFETSPALARVQDSPFVPTSPSGSFAISGTTGLIVTQEYSRTLYLAHTSGTEKYSLVKGDFGEALMDEYFLDEYLGGKQRGNWRRIDPARVVRTKEGLALARPGSKATQGIDGIYMRFDRNGNPKGLLVGEAKFGTSRLGATADGKQMGPMWRASRLALTAQRYAAAASEFKTGNFLRSSSPPSSAERCTNIPIGRNSEVTVWFDKRTNKWTLYTTDDVSGSEIARQLYKTSVYLQKAADGIIAHKARVFSVKVIGRNLLEISSINADTGQIEGGTERVSFNDLPLDMQGRLKQNLVDAIAESMLRQSKKNGIRMEPEQAEKHAKAVVKQAEKENRVPKLIKKYSPRIGWSPRIGLRAAAWGGGGGAVLAGVFDLATQLYVTGTVDWERTGTMSLLGGASGASGAWIGAQLQYALMTETSQRFLSESAARIAGMQLSSGTLHSISQIAGGLGGGVVASAIFSYGSYFLGYSDLRTANRAMIEGTAGTAVGVGAGACATTLVMTFGTASTGTAISALSGAAATNASLAWFGGGSLAAGGLGVAGGTVILTGGIVIVAMAAATTVHVLFVIKDANANRERVAYLVENVHQRLLEGVWSERMRHQELI